MNRRPADVPVHDWQHQLIEERLAACLEAPQRSGMNKIRRREAGKRAAWTLRGHLQGEHGQRSLPVFANVLELESMHRKLHA